MDEGAVVGEGVTAAEGVNGRADADNVLVLLPLGTYTAWSGRF